MKMLGWVYDEVNEYTVNKYSEELEIQGKVTFLQQGNYQNIEHS